MNDKQLEETFQTVKKRVKVSCDENHAHSALEGCLHGDPRDVLICALIETLQRDREAVRGAVAGFDLEAR